MIFVLQLFIIPIATASLGTYKQYNCVDIKTILNTTGVNISTINYPNSTVAISNKVMTKLGTTFNYTFCLTSMPGVYVYDYYNTITGETYVNDFKITPSGENTSNSLIIFIVLILFSIAILLFGIILKNGYIGFVSGLLFLVAGTYSMIYGIADMADMWTRAVSFVLIGMGLMLCVSAGINIIGETGFGIGKDEDDEDF